MTRSQICTQMVISEEYSGRLVAECDHCGEWYVPELYDRCPECGSNRPNDEYVAERKTVLEDDFDAMRDCWEIIDSNEGVYVIQREFREGAQIYIKTEYT